MNRHEISKSTSHDRMLGRRHRETYLQSHRDEWRKYFREYFAEWLKDPINFAIHSTRTITSGIRWAVKNNKPLRHKRLRVLTDALDIGWDPRDKNSIINHIVSVKLIYDFCPYFEKYDCFNKCNLEIISAAENNSYASRVVTERQVEVAAELERLFPAQLKGFERYVKSKSGVTY